MYQPVRIGIFQPGIKCPALYGLLDPRFDQFAELSIGVIQHLLTEQPHPAADLGIRAESAQPKRLPMG